VNVAFFFSTNPTLGANKGYASKTIYFINKTIPCLVHENVGLGRAKREEGRGQLLELRARFRGSGESGNPDKYHSMFHVKVVFHCHCLTRNYYLSFVFA
jgi:hypothetical protein